MGSITMTTATEDASTYLSTVLTEARQRYVKRNPASEKSHQKGKSCMPGGNTRTILHVSPFPLTFASGSGCTLTSVDNDTYTDFLGEYSAGIFGHSNPRIKEAVTEALSRGWNYGGPCEYEKTLAQKVVDRYRNSGMELVRFTNSGTESNMMAIAAAINWTRRKKIMVFTSGYHGGTLIFPTDYIRNPNQPNVNLPHEFVFASYNNITETKAVLESLPPQSLAAILIEPLQGAGGCRPASANFMRFIRESATSYGALLIADEVMASRLGPHGCCETLDVKADLITLGKYVGGGLGFGAFGGRQDVMSIFDPSKEGSLQHPGTYNNNVFTMAAGIAGLDIYNASEVERLNKFGCSFKSKLQEVLISEGIYPKSYSPSQDLIEVDSLKSPTVLREADVIPANSALPGMYITGHGSMVNVRFSGTLGPQWQALYYHHMLQHNIYLAPRGYTPLNLELKEKDIELYLSAFKSFVSANKEFLRQ